LFNERRETIELRAPERAVSINEVLRVAQRRGDQRAVMRAPNFLSAHESSPLQHSQVFGDRW
jgi:hypothetical protein